MPLNGNTFTRLQSWVANAALGLKIRADLMDQDSNDIAGGISAVSAAVSAAVASMATFTTNLAASGGSLLVGFLQSGTGAIARAVQAKLRDSLSVADFGAVGDGVTDDTAAIQAAVLVARLVGKGTYFPTPTVFYKITAPINAGGSCHWIGESGASTIIRNLAGAGAPVFTFDSTGSLGPYVLEHLRIGGAGCIGSTSTPTSFNGTIVGTALTINSGLVGGIQIGGTVTGAGVTAGTVISSGSGNNWVVSINQNVGPVTMTMTNQYVSNLTLKHVHYEGDLLTGIDADCIFANWQDSTFGFYTQTAMNASFAAIKSIGNGVLNSNLNSVERCKFFNATAPYAVQLGSGLLWSFKNCDWENNLRNLTTSNISGLVLENCYTERVQAATGQAFDFGLSGRRIKVIGGEFNGGSLATGVSMIGAASGCPLLVEDANILTSAGGLAYINTTTTLHTPPVSGVHHFKNVRISGNAADPLLFLDGIIEDGVNAFVPAPVGLTVVNGSGGATYSGTWSIRNRMVTVTFRVVTTGTCTTASTAGTTYFPLPTNLPLPQVPATGGVTNELTTASLGVGLAYINGRFFVPAWGAQTGNITMSMTYPI